MKVELQSIEIAMQVFFFFFKKVGIWYKKVDAHKGAILEWASRRLILELLNLLPQ